MKIATSMHHEAVSRRVKSLLKEAGLKQAHLAEKLGIHRQAVNRLLSSEISKSKYFSEIAHVLGVSEEYLMVGNKKAVLMVDEAHLKQLIRRQFELSAEDKTRLEYLYIDSDKNGCFFASKLKFAINQDLSAGSLVVYSPLLDEVKNEGQIFILLSAINQSFIVGKYQAEGPLAYLVNVNGKYLVQQSDIFVGLAVQIIINLGE